MPLSQRSVRFQILPAQVEASLIRLDGVNLPDDAQARIRFGYALGGSNPNIGSPHAAVVRNDGPTRPRSLCKGMRSRFRQKATDLSAAFRESLGFGPVSSTTIPEHTIRILPVGPPSFVFADPHMDDPAHHGRHGHGLSEAPFYRRLNVALMTLGPWEGRAFAFVLGASLPHLVSDVPF